VKSGLDVTVEGDGTFSRLTVKNTTGDVSGTYKVLAENTVGSADAQFQVIILGQFPSFVRLLRSIHTAGALRPVAVPRGASTRSHRVRCRMHRVALRCGAAPHHTAPRPVSGVNEPSQ